ncbi:ABC transporter ATP-binding protein [Mycoplasmopsis ciconiae]|uniref:ABC transporter ATP-binding protein n=1 Tax=Mycoplasmopsis ciconiae TaxID=561067 RepID=A0ABU7MLI0_9BACT|nr:ABC transporter ATP-binding protein [Mycoplasmopsis ciconiae]
MKLINVIKENKKVHLKLILISILVSVSQILSIYFSIEILKYVIYNVQDNITKSLLMLSIFILAEIFQALLTGFSQKLYIKAIYYTHNTLRIKYFEKLTKAHPRYLKNNDNTQLVNLLENDLNFVAQFSVIFSFLTNITMTFVGISIIYIFVSWQLLLIFLGVSILKLFISLFAQSFGAKYQKQVSDNKNNFFAITSKLLFSINTFIFNNKEPYFLNLRQKQISKNTKTKLKIDISKNVFDSIISFINFLLNSSVIIAAFFLVQQDIIGFELLILVIIHESVFSNAINGMFKAIFGVGQLKGILSKIKKDEAQIYYPSLIKKEKLEFVKLENINFSYEEKQIFNNFNLTINSAEKILIKGPSGSGKTTLINIINNLVDNYQGSVVYNNTYYGEFSENSANIMSINNEINLEEKIDLQQLFSNYHNQTITKDELISIFRIDFAKDNMIDFETLSSGEKQRILLLMAYLSDKSLIILDEMLSSIDPKTRKIIFDFLLKDPRSYIFVSHHFSESEEQKLNKIINLQPSL